jgi:glucosamine--fructose-6-phosphate aminotransferase (isomerizing)
MCGIVGYIGYKDSKDILLDGLGELEYRGYDSAGIAILSDGVISTHKSVGKLKNLQEVVKDLKVSSHSIGIGHTRWATHGEPNELNAHPHLGEFSYVVHNGIIENYQELKDELIRSGVKFVSQTDTEVIVHLYEKKFSILKDELEAFKQTIKQLKGAYALLLITKSSSQSIYFAKHGSPMIVGCSSDDIYFGSSDAALLGKANEVIYLEDGEYGYSSYGQIDIFNKDGKVKLNKKPLIGDRISAQKSGFRFFMEKEIYEQSDVLSDAILGRLDSDGVIFDELSSGFFHGIEHIKICACGTSYHAALSMSYIFQRDALIETTVEIASEFRYKKPILSESTLFIVISQSGETADTLEALKMAKKASLKTLAICNVDNSSIVRESDVSLLTRAGIEKGVASTKAFATQIVVLWMLALYIAQSKRSISKDKLKREIEAIKHIPSTAIVKDKVHQQIKRLSKRYLHGHGFFFIGRDMFFPLALEGALKLKEISYLHAEGYPSGEMKHGPIALADSELFTIALMPKNLLYDKVKSNVEELCARDVTLLAISPQEFELADDFIKTQDYSHPMQEFFEMMVVTQLLALEISIRLGNDVDMPRNLAKSVTVE